MITFLSMQKLTCFFLTLDGILGIYYSYHITFWEQSESHTTLSIGTLSDKIRMIFFNFTVTVAVTRNGALLKVVFT